VPQRDERIDVYRAPRRDVTSKQRDTNEKKGDARKCEGVGRPHAVKQPRHQVRNDQRASKPYRSAGDGER